jgi:AcrR family transcriptional regulator
MDRTREKLIETAIDIVMEEGGEKLTIRRVASRADVSVPTAYRHFPDRGALLDAMALKIRVQFGGATIPATADDLPAWLRLVFANYEKNDRLLRAQLNTPVGRSLRIKNQKARAAKLVEMMQRSLPSATASTQRRLTALMYLLAHAPAWVVLHDEWGMDAAEASAATIWAIDVLLAEIRLHPAALDFAQLASPSTVRHRSSASRKRRA